MREYLLLFFFVFWAPVIQHYNTAETKGLNDVPRNTAWLCEIKSVKRNQEGVK